MQIDNTTEIENKLIEIVKSFNHMPFLFLGSGFSIRYSDAPNWNALLESIWEILKEENELNYNFFCNKILINNNMDEKTDKDKRNPIIATELENRFKQNFYNDSDFRNKYFNNVEIDNISREGISPLKLYISNTLSSLKILENEEINSLRKHSNKFAGVITTNYDTIFEQIIPEFHPIIGQHNLLASHSDEIFHIFKIHGCITEPHTIIITKEDYDNFENKLKYISSKLITIFVEHPVIFLGYSINDPNIQAIIKCFCDCLTKEQFSSLSNKLFFIKRTDKLENEKINEKTLNINGFTLPITQIDLYDFNNFYKVLDYIKQSIPVGIMRKMQCMMRDYIVTTDKSKYPQVFVNVRDLNDGVIDDNELAFYIGDIESTSAIGFTTYCIKDIIDDILHENRPVLLNKNIKNTFNSIRSSASKTYLPIYRYKEYIDEIGPNWRIITKTKNIELTNSDKDLLKTIEKKSKSEGISLDKIVNIESLFPNHLPKQLTTILKYYKSIDTDDLGNYLRLLYIDNIFEKQTPLSIFKKAVALYDYKKNS